MDDQTWPSLSVALDDPNFGRRHIDSRVVGPQERNLSTPVGRSGLYPVKRSEFVGKGEYEETPFFWCQIALDLDKPQDFWRWFSRVDSA